MSLGRVAGGLAFSALVTLCACAERIDAGERSGNPCKIDEDCNAANSCGVRRLCVAGRCEVETTKDGSGSVIVPCGEATSDDDSGTAD